MGRYLLFSVGEYDAAVEIESVVHIIDASLIQPAFGQDIVKGLVMEQNVAFCAVEIRDRIKSGFKIDHENKVLVIDLSQEKNEANLKIGFIVDRVHMIIEIERPDTVDEHFINKEEVHYTIHTNNKIYPVLDFGYFLSAEDLALAKSVMKKYEDNLAAELSSTNDSAKKESEAVFRRAKIEKLWRVNHDAK